MPNFIKLWNHSRYQSMDYVLYAMMNSIQWRLRHEVTSRDLLEAYLKECASLNRSDFYGAEPMEDFSFRKNCSSLQWKSPLLSDHVENNQAQALFFPASYKSDTAPTLIILHSLMSASDYGYRRIAKQMNQQGWNVLFPHLPFHYSRKPKNYPQGSLAITADLIRNGETLRQAVKEMRQLIHWARNEGSEKITLLGTSYGGWIASLLMSVEPVDFSILLQPITDIHYATFESPLSYVMASLLKKEGITRDHLDQHAHLTAPTYGKPLCNPEHLFIIGGCYDKISPPNQLRHCSECWKGSIYHEVQQGHFGYHAMKLALELIKQIF